MSSIIWAKSDKDLGIVKFEIRPRRHGLNEGLAVYEVMYILSLAIVLTIWKVLR